MTEKIKILKASAGSGKTFALAKEYIRLLLQSGDPYAYRHILAVTFTNKATDEMKGRILKELDILASNPEKSSYLADMEEYTGKDKRYISSMSKTLLSNILNDYSAFSVSTIDRFFQRALKAFSREIGQFASYQVELDKNSLIKESVDRILDSLTEKDKVLVGWLTDSFKDNLDRGRRFDMGESLYDMAVALKNEEHRDVVEQNGIDETAAYSKEALSALKKSCDAIIGQFLSELRRIASAIVKGFVNAGVDLADTVGKGRTFRQLEKYADLQNYVDFELPKDTLLSTLADKDKWFAKANAQLLPLVQHLETEANEFCALFEAPYVEFNTAVILRAQIYALGLCAELNLSFDTLMKEKNVLSLDDSNTILKGIIDGSDAPFIYEKLGVRFDHFLLDEFQDTARIQWENFRPLLENSVANGNANLIVGDVKQSIYRWRNSDWNLLNSELKSQFGSMADEQCLTSNWRSTRTIVEFNNGFYKFAAKSLDGILGDGAHVVSDIYSDVKQDVESKEEACGNVNVILCKTGLHDDGLQLQSVLAEVDRLTASGANYSDIGILVRTNGQASLIAESLLEKGFPVISDEALSVKASLAVRRIVALMSYANNPDNKLNAFLASSLDVSIPSEWHSLVDLCEHFIRSIRQSQNTDYEGEVSYIQAFMDCLQEWVGINGNSLGEFLEFWDGQDPKISSPDDADAVRVMTIHKSKGLAFPYVIFPFAESALYKQNEHWCYPAVEGTGLEIAGNGVYRVNLTENSALSYFSESYWEERKMQLVDAINAYYVATTRAEKGMTIIAPMPSKDFKDGKSTYKKMSDVLYDYVLRDAAGAGFRSIAAHPEMEDYAGEDEAFMLGEDYVFQAKDDAGQSDAGANASGYPSFALNPEEGLGRLEFSSDSADFFSEDGTVGIGASGRLRGVVLHDILSEVIVPEDLDSAVEASFAAGSIGSEDRDSILSMLKERVESASRLGWFPADRSKVFTESSVINVDGEVYRPDRVIVDGKKVIVVDYKFGKEEKKYLRQIGNYARLYKSMGYPDVEAYLWYVENDKVVRG